MRIPSVTIPVDPPDPYRDYSDFERELGQLLNRHNLEKESGTPDFILAEFLTGCLRSYNSAVGNRATWYGGHSEFKPSLGVPDGSS